MNLHLSVISLTIHNSYEWVLFIRNNISYRYGAITLTETAATLTRPVVTSLTACVSDADVPSVGHGTMEAVPVTPEDEGLVGAWHAHIAENEGDKITLSVRRGSLLSRCSAAVTLNSKDRITSASLVMKFDKCDQNVVKTYQSGTLFIAIACSFVVS